MFRHFEKLQAGYDLRKKQLQHEKITCSTVEAGAWLHPHLSPFYRVCWEMFFPGRRNSILTKTPWSIPSWGFAGLFGNWKSWRRVVLAGWLSLGSKKANA